MSSTRPNAGFSLSERVHIALELAENTRMEHDGFHHLVSELVGQLTFSQAKTTRASPCHEA